MRKLSLALIAVFFCTPVLSPTFAKATVGKQDSQDDVVDRIREKIDKILDSSAKKLRKELVDVVKDELDQSGGKATVVKPGNLDDALKLITEDLLKKHLRGATRVRVNSATGKFAEMLDWLEDTEMATAQQARDMLRMAEADGVSDLYLCMIH